MFSSQTVLGTTRPIIVSHTSENQTVNGTAHMRRYLHAICYRSRDPFTRVTLIAVQVSLVS
jgi:hypothetical protein